MFDWLKDIIKELWHYLIPFIVIYQYERGVRMRLGKHATVLYPGFHFKIPFIDDVHRCNVENETKTTLSIHITTTDEKTVTVTPVIKYKIVNAIKWITEANDANTNLHDITRGIVADYLTDITWAECKKKTTVTKIKNKLNEKIEDLGIIISEVMLTDLCISRVLITKI
jgi:regulator of protease activity HflC (stomatin/prohibitin superfamily)